MNKANYYYIASGLLAVTSGIYIAYRIGAKTMDRKAAEFLAKLTIAVQPSGEQIEENNGFDEGFADRMRHKYGHRLIELKPHVAKDMAEAISDAWGWIWDSDREVLGIFRKLADKVQLSQVAREYYEIEGITLLDDISDRLANSPEILAKVVKLANGLEAKRLA